MNSNLYFQANGTVKSFGANTRGELGSGNTINQNFPTFISNVNDVAQIYAGNYFSLLILSNFKIIFVSNSANNV